MFLIQLVVSVKIISVYISDIVRLFKIQTISAGLEYSYI